MSNTWYINSEVRGNNILLTYVHDGVVKYAKVPNYAPVLFFEGNDPTYNFKDAVDGIRLMPRKFKSIREAQNEIRSAREVSGHKVYGNRNFNYTFLHENFTDMENSYNSDLIRGFILDIECPSEVGFPDPGKAEWPINVMGIYDTKTKKYYIWGLEEYDIAKYADKLLEEDVDPNDVVYHHIPVESDMLAHMADWWSKNHPAYLSGWNTSTFDNPYLVHRLMKCGINPGLLSPWGVTTTREREFMGKPVHKAYILGVADLDYIELYKDNRFKVRESYKLDFIAHVELGKKKVDYSEVASSLRTLHKEDWDLYTTYNVMDVALVKQLEDKLGYLEITFAVAYAAGINYSDVSSPVATWENILYRDLINDGIVLPPKKNNDKVSYEGGYVKAPQQGKHRWVVSFDLNSLYPHLIMGSNISPETITPMVVPDATVENILGGVKTGNRMFNMPEGNVSVCASGYTFTNEFQGVAGRQMHKLYIERKGIKGEMLGHEQDVEDIKAERGLDEMMAKYDLNSIDGLLAAAERMASRKDGGQHVRKILLNSFYGALANVHFCMFDIRLAESITKQGQLAIRWAGDWVNKELNKILKTNDVDYVVYTDTDSIYVSMEDVVNANGYDDKETAETVRFLDEYCEQVMQPIIDNGYKSLQWHCNSFDQKMVMAREVISDNSIFCTKKRYAMSVWNSEGVAFEDAYIKTMGLDVVKSSTPEVVRGAMKKTIRMILNEGEQDVQQYIRDFKKDFRKEKPEAVAFPRGVNKLEESYCDVNGNFLSSVTIPINSRAGMVHNKLVRELNLVDYKEIIPGDKIKFIHVELPNKANTNVVGFTDVLPPEFNMHHKIDYNLMYEKTYLKPMRDIIELIGWSTEPQATLDSFFG